VPILYSFSLPLSRGYGRFLFDMFLQRAGCHGGGSLLEGADYFSAR
jgi:hypothetical protein